MRLFIGIDPPAPLKARLLGLMGGLAGARWQREDQLHLTLRFIGEVDGAGAQDLDAALAAIDFPIIPLALEGVGAFGGAQERQGEGPGRPRSLWVGAQPADVLARLHRKVDRAAERAGLGREGRAFVPHITIARFGKGRMAPLNDFLAGAGGMRSDAAPVSDFCLYESRLTRDGPHYSVLARYPLRGD